MSDEETRKSLVDVLQAIEEIEEFVEGLTFADYRDDRKTQRAVERAFEIIGEALNRIKRVNPGFLEGVPAHHKIIGFRNILAHGYDQVDERIVWNAVTLHVPSLKGDIQRLLDLEDPQL